MNETLAVGLKRLQSHLAEAKIWEEEVLEVSEAA